MIIVGVIKIIATYLSTHLLCILNFGKLFLINCVNRFIYQLIIIICTYRSDLFAYLTSTPTLKKLNFKLIFVSRENRSEVWGFVSRRQILLFDVRYQMTMSSDITRMKWVWSLMGRCLSLVCIGLELFWQIV